MSLSLPDLQEQLSQLFFADLLASGGKYAQLWVQVLLFCVALVVAIIARSVSAALNVVLLAATVRLASLQITTPNKAAIIFSLACVAITTLHALGVIYNRRRLRRLQRETIELDLSLRSVQNKLDREMFWRRASTGPPVINDDDFAKLFEKFKSTMDINPRFGK